MNEKLKEPRIYLCAAVFISMFLPWASCESSADVMGISASGSASISGVALLQSNFITSVLLFIAIIVYTLIHDFALNKDAIKEKGLKGAISDIAGEVSEEMSETVKKTNFELPSSKCPQCGEKVEIKVYPENCESCGKPLIKGKNYCPDCGTKVQ